MISYGYVRVSGRSQVDGDGPERQRDTIWRFCKSQGLGDPQFFFEAAVSGTVEAMDRPKLVCIFDSIEMLRQLDSKAEVCIVVERLDRLARDLIVSELLLKECADRNIPVYSADQDTLANQASTDADPTRKVIRQIMGALAEWEKSVLVLKLRKARNRMRHKTGRCEGVRPYGSLPGELDIQRRLQEWRYHGFSFGKIARSANEHGLRSRSGEPWTRGAVYQAIIRRGVKTEPFGV